MKQTKWKTYIPDIIIFAVFLLASAIYFMPALQGKVVYAVDNINGTAAVHESWEYHDRTGEYTYWTGSMFSGMPNYQIGGNGGGMVDHILRPVRMFFSWGTRNAFFILLFYLCAFFLLMRSFGIDKWLSMAGAFAIALSSYFFVIIAASHHGKCYSITWMTLVIVGFVLTYRKKYAWGALIVMFFTYIGFFLHPQMSYYICMLIGLLFFAEMAVAAKEKEWKHFAVASLIFFASFAVGMGMGSTNILTNKEYAAETMRGGHSDLAKATDETNKTAGLDLDYATAWSYGIKETMTFLIPNFMGGASGYNAGTNSVLYKELVDAGVPKSSSRQFCQSAPTYWGEKAFTSGPVYMGAIVCFLFLLGLLVVTGPYKWALLAATLFSLLLSWGHNFMPLTEFFFHYFPMYNKFRAVESILIVAEITMPLLAFLALKELGNSGKDERQTRWYKKAVLISGGITGVVCLLVALFAGSIDVTSSYDPQWTSRMPDYVIDAVMAQRTAMISSDAWRSLIFIVPATALTFWYVQPVKMDKGEGASKPKTMIFGIALCALIVADMWPVDKRFCNDSHFISNRDKEKNFAMQPYEKLLLDTDKSYYRVFNFANNPFNEARTSYRLHSVGGYSAAKLRRYQDLIDEHLMKMNMNVFNMLNTKYFITQGNNGALVAQRNPEAMGNAWFVDSVLVVDNANDESEALRTLDLRKAAVTDKQFEVFASTSANDPTARTEFVSYAPDRLEYKASCSVPKTLVFSEIYYPHGWKATVDGQPADIFRVNYMLRAINLPAGEHSVVMSFAPDSVRIGNIISVSCLIIFLLTLAASIVFSLRRTKNEKAD